MKMLNPYQIQQRKLTIVKVRGYLAKNPMQHFNLIRKELNIGTGSLRKALIALLLHGDIIRIKLDGRFSNYLFFILKRQYKMVDYVNQRMERDRRTLGRESSMDLDELTVMIIRMASKSKRSVCKEHGISTSQFDRLVKHYSYLQEFKRGLGQ